MKYVRNIFKRTRMLIEYLILLDDYRSRLLNWGHLFDRVSWFWLGFFFFFQKPRKGEGRSESPNDVFFNTTDSLVPSA